LLRVQYSKLFEIVAEAKIWLKDKLSDLPKLVEILNEILEHSNSEVIQELIYSNRGQIEKGTKILQRLVKTPFSTVEV
jgi:hypothetical protein